jgi:hypothetical protein
LSAPSTVGASIAAAPARVAFFKKSLLLLIFKDLIKFSEIVDLAHLSLLQVLTILLQSDVTHPLLFFES